MKVLGLLFFVESFVIGADLYHQVVLWEGSFLNGQYVLNVLLLFSILFLAIASAALFFHRPLRTLFKKELKRILDRPTWMLLILIILVLLMIESFQDILFLQADMEAIHYLGYRQLLSKYFSLLIGLLLGSIQLLILVSILGWKHIKAWMSRYWKSRIITILIGSFVLFVFMIQSKLGSFKNIQEHLGFNELNAPLLGLQVFSISLVLILIVGILNWLGKKVKWSTFFKRDLILMIIIGLIAYLSWISVPLKMKAFTDAARPPNFVNYPTSDAMYYERAGQQVRVGNGIVNNNHIGFLFYLAGIHAIAGDGVMNTLLFHLGILSFAPLLLYLLASSLHTRFSGLLVSILFIIRIRTTLLIGEHITVSGFNDIMTEPLTTLGVILFSTLLIFWLMNTQKNQYLPLIAGGVMGLTILIRIEVATMVAAIAIALFLFFRKQPVIWLRSMITFGLGMLFVMGPWLINGVVTTKNINFIFMEEELEIAGTFQSYTAQDEGDPVETGSDNPDYFPHHLAQNLKQMILYLPSNHQPLLTIDNLPDLVRNPIDVTDLEGDRFSEKYLERYVRSLPYWWNDWDGRVVSRSYIPLAFTIILLVAGFVQLRGEKIWLGVMLLSVSFAQAFIYAFIGNSGGRFIAIVDWVPQVFLGIGLSWIITLIIKSVQMIGFNKWWITEKPIAAVKENLFQKINPTTVITGAMLLILGLSFPIAEVWIPKAYTQFDKAKLAEEVTMQINGVDFIDTDLEVVYGKALYPRFFKADQRMEDDRDGTIPEYTYKRVEFYLVGTDNVWITLPGQEGKEYFPHGSDVLIKGMRVEEYRDTKGERIYGEYIKAQQIVILTDGKEQISPKVLNCTGRRCAP